MPKAASSKARSFKEIDFALCKELKKSIFPCFKACFKLSLSSLLLKGGLSFAAVLNPAHALSSLIK